jgi:hypothetical protein
MLPRIQDVLHESQRILLPVEGYQNKRLMPLAEAVEPLSHIFDSINLRTKVFIAKDCCQQPADSLSQDESLLSCYIHLNGIQVNLVCILFLMKLYVKWIDTN